VRERKVAPPLASGYTYDPPVSIWVAAELTWRAQQFLRPSVVLDGPLATGDLSPTLVKGCSRIVRTADDREPAKSVQGSMRSSDVGR